MDVGWEGLVRTIDMHEEVGIQTVGSFRTEEEANTPVIVETDDGVKVGFVSQTYGLNGIPKAEGKDWSVTILDAEKAIADATAAREAGADIVAVHMHAGTEYDHNITEQQEQFAETVTASGEVDLVFGQHAHVVQPVDRVNDTWVIYGMGNLIAQQSASETATYDGFMAEVEFVENADGTFSSQEITCAPTMITRHSGGNPARVYVIPQALAAGVGDAGALEASAERTREVVTRLDVPGLTELS